MKTKSNSPLAYQMVIALVTCLLPLMHTRSRGYLGVNEGKMPKTDKGFSKLNHESIELNTFHGSESDDEVGMRMGTPSPDCATCGLTRYSKPCLYLWYRLLRKGVQAVYRDCSIGTSVILFEGSQLRVI